MTTKLPDLDPAAVGRLYNEGLRAEDLVFIPADHLVVTPVMPTRRTPGGLWTSSGATEIPGTAAVAFRVVRDAEFPQNIGDVVVVRNAMLEPLSKKMDLLLIERRHVISTILIPLAPVDEPDTEPAPFRGPVEVATPAMLLSPTVGVYDG